MALQEIKTGGSVLSSRDAIAHFGLANGAPPVSLTIRWPDGARQEVKVDRIDREIVIQREPAARR